MKAIFEFEFNPDNICPEDILQEEYSGSWLLCLKTLLDEHGLSIYDLMDGDFKIIKVKE